MKIPVKQLCRGLMGAAALFLSIASAQAAGLMRPHDNSIPAPDIRSHDVTVVIEDGYSVTTVDQVFFNASPVDLEATYEFPIPERGTIAEFTVWIDDQPVVGEVVEKERARQLYEQEKAAGRETGLAEKQKFYRFETHVSPVRAGQETRTRIVYLQPADVDGGIGRYSYPLEEGGTDDKKNAFWHTDSAVKGSFSFDLKLRSGYPIDAIRVPTQPQAQISSKDAHEWQVQIGHISDAAKTSRPVTSETTNTGDAEDSRSATFNAAAPSDLDALSATSDVAHSEVALAQGAIATSTSVSYLNEDVVIYWRLTPGLPGAVDLVTHRAPGAKTGTFLMTVTPGIDLAPITEGRDWVFVLDTSGSMQQKIAVLVDGVTRTLGKLTQGDRFRIVQFNDSAKELTRGWTELNQENVSHTVSRLSGLIAQGGTNLYAGIKKSLRALDADRTASIVLVTDGVANVGVTERRSFLKLMRKHDVRLFTAILGNGANRPLLKSMTDVSRGFAVSVSNADDIEGVLVRTLSKVSHQALHDVEVHINGVRTESLVPAKPVTLYRGEQLVIAGHYFGSGDAEVKLTTRISGEKKNYETRFNFAEVATSNPEIERLWAFATIEHIRNENDYLGVNQEEDRGAIVDLATKYGLVTDFTSMVVMSDEQFEAEGIKRLNRDRRAVETASAQQRRSQAVVSRRVDTQKPMFSNNRSYHSPGGGGTGAMDPWMLLVLSPLLLTLLSRVSRFTRQQRQ